MIALLRPFLALTARQRRLLGEAAVMLALARLAVIFLSFRRLAPLLSRWPETDAGDVGLIREVRWAVTLAARHVPWNAVCLPQAIAAKAMLGRRGCGSSFHLGAGRDAAGALIGHAWLVAGGTVVVGERAIADVAPLLRLG